MNAIGKKLFSLAATMLLAALPILYTTACGENATTPAPSSGGKQVAGTGGSQAATGGSTPAASGGSSAAASGGSSAATSGGSSAATSGGTTAPSGTGGNVDWSTANPKEIIKAAGAADATIQGKLDHYADVEVGTPVIGLEGTGVDRVITNTILVPPGVTYDGKGEKLDSKGLGDGSQDEAQKPYFILAPGANLKNVTIGSPGCEGVHMMGNNTLDNVTWTNAGEDAASCRSYFPQNTTNRIFNSKVNSCQDKCFQINAPGTKLILKNIRGGGVNKLVRQNESIKMSVVLDDIDVGGCKTAVLMVNNGNCSVMHRNVKSTPLFEGNPTKLSWVDGASD